MSNGFLSINLEPQVLRKVSRVPRVIHKDAGSSKRGEVNLVGSSNGAMLSV